MSDWTRWMVKLEASVLKAVCVCGCDRSRPSLFINSPSFLVNPHRVAVCAETRRGAERASFVWVTLPQAAAEQLACAVDGNERGRVDVAWAFSSSSLCCFLQRCGTEVVCSWDFVLRVAGCRIFTLSQTWCVHTFTFYGFLWPLLPAPVSAHLWLWQTESKIWHGAACIFRGSNVVTWRGKAVKVSSEVN